MNDVPEIALSQREWILAQLKAGRSLTALDVLIPSNRVNDAEEMAHGHGGGIFSAEIWQDEELDEIWARCGNIVQYLRG